MKSFRSWLLKLEMGTTGIGDLPKAPSPEELLSGTPGAMPTYSKAENPPVQNHSPSLPKNAKEVAEEFYAYMGGRFPGCSLGIAGTSKENPGSGNCAWTARRFWAWSKAKARKFPEYTSQGKFYRFHTPKENSPHILFPSTRAS